MGFEGSSTFGAWIQKVQRVQRVEVGASKFIEGASLYKTFTIGLSPIRKQASLASLEEMHSPFGG